MSPSFSLRACAAASSFVCAAVSAQAPSTALPEVTITGNPLGSAEVIAPVQRLSDTGLLLRQQPTLGETLSGLPGVSSTYFGPTASRPVIRGLDGDRIRVLQNGSATLDASSLSNDHAVAADPLGLQRVEILRGPAALLYGGNAIGGVVNLIDERIPRSPVEGVTGRADVSAATGNRERAGAVMVQGGTSRFALHADAFGRDTRDVRVPAEFACTQGGVTSISRRICNSASETRGGSVGGTVFFGKGYLGASRTEFDSNYGSVAEDEVTIGMKSARTSVEGQLRDLAGALRSVKLQAAHTDYRHTEFDAGAPGTRFTQRGNDVRLEARHAPLGPLEGVVGVQAERSRFGADGVEAFAPFSSTSQRALFIFEELGTSWGKLNFGARREWVEVESLGNPNVARFVVGERTFGPTSASIGALWNVAPAWQLTGSLASSQRAPRDYELFADGPHVATGAYEVGDPSAAIERSTNAEVGIRWKGATDRFSVTAFRSRFSNYLALLSTGLVRDELPEFAYRGVRAQFRGLEAEGSVRVFGAAGHTVDLELRGDIVRADNRTRAEPLPRISPRRVGATLAWSRGGWGARLGVDHWARQDRAPTGERAVPGYALWNAALTYQVKAGPAELLWYARLDNATDRLASSATSILTQSAPGRVPLPGRSLRAGVRAEF